MYIFWYNICDVSVAIANLHIAPTSYAHRPLRNDWNTQMSSPVDPQKHIRNHVEAQLPTIADSFYEEVAARIMTAAAFEEPKQNVLDTVRALVSTKFKLPQFAVARNLEEIRTATLRRLENCVDRFYDDPAAQ